MDMILKIYINKNINTIFFYLYKKEKLITNFDDFSLFFVIHLLSLLFTRFINLAFTLSLVHHLLGLSVVPAALFLGTSAPCAQGSVLSSARVIRFSGLKTNILPM